MEAQALEQLLNSCGEQIIDIYRKKLSEFNINASGKLGNDLSCFVQIEDDVYELCLQIQDYWKYVEDGREAGTFPNVDALKRWIQVKPILPRPYNGVLPSINSLAYLIGRKIQRDGIEGKHILAATLEEVDKMQIIEQGVDKKIQDEITITFNTLK